MAFLPTDDKQQNQNQQNPGAQPGDSSGAAAAAASSSGGTPSGGTPSSYGAGGSGWTNIQSYLTANQGNSGSAQALNNQVGSAFNKDSQNLQDQSSQTKQQGQAQVVQNNISQDKASQMVQAASSQYGNGAPNASAATVSAPQYGSGGLTAQGAPDPSQQAQAPQSPANPYGNQDYSSIVNALKLGVNGTYGGPKSFSYGLGADTQNYGSALGNDQGFQGVMQGVYDKAGAGPMGSGSLALQSQLDTNNGAVNDARKNLAQQYAGLQSNVASTTADTNAALQADQKAYADNEAALKGYLNTDAGSAKGAIDQRVNDINDFMNHAYANHAINDAGSNFNYYRTGDNVNESNASGMGDQRNTFDTIQDVLGGNKIVGGKDLKASDVMTHADTQYGNGMSSQYQQSLQDYMNNEYDPTSGMLYSDRAKQLGLE